ncbi:hypothetical protein GCM10017788_36710 [Amycolatopsis acidiphila]|nr:hypothetical protein GCM10017788_36710 [Amycolatopsis acidiphila]
MSSIIERAADHFYMFTDYRRRGHLKPLFTTVEEHIANWVQKGEAWKDCAGDVRIYFATVAFIFAQWHDDREAEDHAHAELAGWESPLDWCINKALKNERTIGGTEIFDPFFFQASRPCD